MTDRTLVTARPLLGRYSADRLLQTVVVAVGIATILLIWAGLGYHLHVQREAVIAQTHRDVQNLSSALEEQVERVVVGVDQVMQFIQEDFVHDRDRFSFKTWMDRSTSLKTIALQISLFDASGELIALRDQERPELPRFDIKDRDYFRALSTQPDLGLHVDRTVVGRVSGRHLFQLARRLNEPDGRFAGLIVVSLDPNYFADQFRSIDVGSGGSVALFGLDGYIRARSPAVAGMYDRDATISSGRGIFEHLKDSASGTYRTVSGLDGADRIIGYRLVGNLPLAVTVGKLVSDMMAPFEAERRRVVIVGLVASAALLSGLILLVGELERRRQRDGRLRRAEAALRENSLRLENTLEAMDQGLLMIDAEGVIQVSNRRAAELLDFSGDPSEPPRSYREVREHARREGRWGRPTGDAPTWILGTERRSRDVRYERRTDDGRTLDIRSVPTADGGVVQTFTDVTHLKEAEATARAAQRTAQNANGRLLLAEQIAQVGHWRVELAANTLTWSDEVYRIHGLDIATYAPDVATAIEAYHPDDREDVACKFALAARNGTPFEHGSRILRPDGGVRDVVSRGLCEFGPAGEVTTLFGTIMDVTNLRRAEREAAQTASLLKATLESMDQGLMVISPEGRIEICNGRASELLDLAPDLMAAKPAARSVLEHQWAAGELDAEDEDVRRLMREDGTAAGTRCYTRTRPNGTVLEIRTMPMAGGGFVRTHSDITARRAAEEAMRTSEQRYRLLADNASDLIILGYGEGSRTYISPAVRPMLGYTIEEAHAIPTPDWIHPEDIEAVTAAAGGLSAEAPTVSVLYRLRHKSGHYIWAEAVLRRVERENDVTVLSAIRDVTERQRQARHLEQAKIAAEAGARVKAEFLANMSHELRTPLTGILGVHDLLRSDPTLSERQRHFVGLAEQSGRSLLTIVNDILDFSKIEAGQMPMERVAFSLRELVEGCRALAAETNRNRAVDLATDVSDETPDLLMGDPTRVRQVLLNLTTNALKFTSEGRVSIAAGWSSGRLRIEVADTGVGIAQEALPHLFERFSQADGSTTRRFGGTGLGLAICKRLVEMMGGAIGVESTPGQGSTFRVELPLDTVEPAQSAERRGDGDGVERPAAWARRILVAEDNAVNRQIIEAVLAQSGHHVVIVDDGLAVVEAFRSAPFDIVLMDVQMPGQDGLAATREIRACEEAEGWPKTPVVALTANAMEDEVERCREAGMDAHVAKPIDWGALFQTVDALCIHDAALDAVPVLEEQKLDVLSSILGPERVTQFLASFRRETDRFLDQVQAEDATPSDLARSAHTLVSLAGQLGFAELSAFCAGLEVRALGGGGPDLVPELRVLIGRARRAAAGSRYAGTDAIAA